MSESRWTPAKTKQLHQACRLCSTKDTHPSADPSSTQTQRRESRQRRRPLRQTRSFNKYN